MSRSTLVRGAATSAVAALAVGGVTLGAHWGAALSAQPKSTRTTHSTAIVPAAAQTAKSTSFSFVSAAGDYIGQGAKSTYKPSASTTVKITGDKSHLSVAVQTATENWSVDLSPGVGDTLRLGTFSGAERDSFKTGRSPAWT